MKKHSVAMSSQLKTFGALFTAISAFHVNANELELSINDELIDLRFTSGYEQDFAGQLAFMHSDFNDLSADKISYRFFTRDSESGLELGAKVFWLDVEKEGGFGIALGGGINRSLSDKLDLGLQVYYAPDIVTGGDFKNMLEYDLRLNYQMVENGSFFFGYRKIEADNGNFDLEVFDNSYFGLKFEF